jgi:hypothetical protein
VESGERRSQSNGAWRIRVIRKKAVPPTSGGGGQEQREGMGAPGDVATASAERARDADELCGSGRRAKDAHESQCVHESQDAAAPGGGGRGAPRRARSAHKTSQKTNPADIPSRLHEMDATQAREEVADLGTPIRMKIPETGSSFFSCAWCGSEYDGVSSAHMTDTYNLR